LRIARYVVRKELERDESPKLQVFGLVHDAHPAAAEFLNDAVVGDGLPIIGANLTWLIAPSQREQSYGGGTRETAAAPAALRRSEPTDD